MQKVKIGVVGCGNISSIYFENLTKNFENTEVYACSDLNGELARSAAAKWNIPHVMTLEQMLEDPGIKIILNITTPQGHYPICKKALQAGKNVYVEKPLSLSFEEGCDLVEIARTKGLLLGGAPDTFMGAGIQTSMQMIQDGVIGETIGASAFMMCHGHESWHPAPEFYYKKGGGPLFDMGPYYLTALVSLMGGVREVSGMTAKAFESRTITSEPQYGKIIEVEVPTHVSALLRFDNGAVASLITSFDVWGSTLPRIEIYGTRGTLLVPDPNTFGGPVLLASADGKSFGEVELTHSHSENSRGIGVSDMARCIAEGGRPRAGSDLTNHVLEIMCAIGRSDDSGHVYKMTSGYVRSAPLAPLDQMNRNHQKVIESEL
ncbi:MAG: Gfo/Idh/MocA family protein [Saccharofermentanales bacterium]